TYRPGKTAWSIGRLKYEGTRQTSSGGGTADGLEVFCSEGGVGATYFERVGHSEATFTGDYWIVLPSCRTYMDSAADSPDECWVVAMHKSGTNPKLITSRWFSKIYAPGGSDPWTDYADGTLSSGEVSAGNTILDSSDSELSSRYLEEAWSNIQIRAYN